jgi:hypothetical protein
MPTASKGSGVNSGRNLKGQNGRVKVEELPKGDRRIDLDGMVFQVGRNVSEELLAALSTSLRPWQGYSIMDKIQLELDPILDRLMAQEPAEDGRDPGRAEAYTMVLAIIRNPYAPDYADEKKLQVERFYARNGDDE